MTGGVKNGGGERVMNVTFSVALAKAQQEA